MKQGDYPRPQNYPALYTWLVKHEAVCLWELDQGPMATVIRKGEIEYVPVARLIAYQFRNGSHAIVKVHHKRMGWDIYTPAMARNVAFTLADAEKRLHLESGTP